MLLSSDYGCSICNINKLKGLVHQIFLKFYIFRTIVFHFFINSFLKIIKINNKLSWWISRELQKKELLSFLRQTCLKSNKTWFSIKNTLSLASRKPKKALCGDNEGIWRSVLKYLITVQHNRLVLEQWTKRWMTVSSSKLQNEQSEVLCLRNKKSNMENIS